MDIDCHCGSGLRPNTKYCGNRLIGRDCSPNVVFTCGSSYPNPEDACPNGCRNGICKASRGRGRQTSRKTNCFLG